MAQDSRARRAAKGAASKGTDLAVDAAVSKTVNRVASTAAGVKGVEDVVRRPTSVRAWAKAGARTGVSWALNFVAPGAGGRIEEVISAIGYKRIVYSVLFVVGLTTAMVGAVVIGAVAAVESVMKPSAVVSSVLDMIPGMGDDDSLTQEDIDELGRVCRAVPDPKQVLVNGADPESTETFVPEAVIDANGKATVEVTEAMKLIPPSADPLRAETWLAYRFSHPGDDPHRDWDAFAQIYEPAYSLVVSHKDAPSDDVDGPRTDITPNELLMNIDPYGIYEPYYLAAASSVAYLGMEEWFDNISDAQLSTVMGRAMSLCGV